MFGTRTKAERDRERIELNEFLRRARANELPAARSDEVPACPKHNFGFKSDVAPKPLASECPRCKQEIIDKRRRRTEPLIVMPAPWRRPSAREESAWEQHLAEHKDEFIARGNVGAVDGDREASAIARIDQGRGEELEELRDTFAARRARRMKWWGRR
jgi:predicted Zn-ribbon and HTH transcriptional regulator